MAAYITVGAKTTHGGTVISGSPHSTHNGIPIARKGDKVICTKCKKVVTIATGDPTFIVDGQPIARHGDVTSCGSKLIANQQSFAFSDFEVGSIAQAAPLVFPETEKDDILIKSVSSDKQDEEIHFTIKVVEFNNEGDYLRSYDLEDNPSQLLANSSNWHKEKGFDKVTTLASDTYESIIDGIVKGSKSIWGSSKETAKELGKGTMDSAQHTKKRALIYLGIIETGLKDFPQRSMASSATAMMQFGQKIEADFVYISGSGGVTNYGFDMSLCVNVHNGKVYVPNSSNVNVHSNRPPSVGAKIGAGRIISSNADNDSDATDRILSGEGHSFSLEYGPVSGSLDTTSDGQSTAANIGYGIDFEYKVKAGGSSAGASKGYSNMTLATSFKYNARKNIIEYIRK